jgi:hypothetical protein
MKSNWVSSKSGSASQNLFLSNFLLPDAGYLHYTDAILREGGSYWSSQDY